MVFSRARSEEHSLMSPAAIVVRPARPGDLDALLRLVIAFREHLGRNTPPEKRLVPGFERLLRDGSVDILLALDAAGAEAGYTVTRHRWSAFEDGLEAELEDVFVAARMRGQGIGRRLLETAVARARALGCCQIGLQTNERNAAAVALYEQAGFTAARARWDGGRQIWLSCVLTD
jgi:ribosomal protein S18 acetylase RimI-like enzyme